MSVDLLVLLGLYALFLVPVLLRARAEATPRGEIRELLLHPLAAPPGVLVHLGGALLVVAGIAIAAVRGRVGPVDSPRAMVGSALLVGAAALGAWALAHLRSWRFMPVLDPSHELCTTGPYGWVRHPIYAAINLVGLGSVLWAPNVLVVAGAVCFALGGDLRARAEEVALVDRFGNRYRDYARRVSRLIPGIY